MKERNSDISGGKGRGLPAIVAIATPVGVGALAVVRISGEGAHEIVGEVFRGARRWEEYRAREAIYGKIYQENGEVLDEVVVVRYEWPKSYTGEDMVEISCHGGVLVTAGVVGLLLRKGARSAEAGEFTLRAFLNGKIDLTQAEAVMDMIHAKTPLALRAATEQLGGGIGRETEGIREGMVEIVAHLEAWIDFPEEDIDLVSRGELERKMREVRGRIEGLLATAEEGRVLREGIRLAIWGCPNAGKSSLLNRILGYDRAIVSEVPGTTRDTIEEYANLRGVPFRVIDTAGLREGVGEIEQEGIERARRAIGEADVWLEVVDVSTGERSELPEREKPWVIALNKTDLEEGRERGDLGDFGGVKVCEISCRTGEGMGGLVDALVEAAGVHSAEERTMMVAINARHQACLVRAREALERARELLEQGGETALVSVELRGAIDAVGEVAGVIDTEEILGKIFASFCIGK